MECNVLVKTDNMERAEWLKQRRAGIGGSDVGAICGLNKYKSPIGVYLEKIGELGEEDTASEAAYWGTTLEEVVAKEFTLRTGKRVKRKNAILQSKEYPFMFANVDRLIIGEKAGLECKTASEYVKDQWTDDNIPDSYILQCMHYMIVTGLKKWYIAALIGGNKFIWKEIEYDQETADYLIAIEKEFWDHIEKRIPPAVDGTDASKSVLNVLYPTANENTIELNNEVDILIAKRDELDEAAKELEVQKSEIENKIKEMLGENEKGITSMYEVKWSNRSKTSVDSKKLKTDMPEIFEKYSKVSHFRQLSIKQLKH